MDRSGVENESSPLIPSPLHLYISSHNDYRKKKTSQEFPYKNAVIDGIHEGLVTSETVVRNMSQTSSMDESRGESQDTYTNHRYHPYRNRRNHQQHKNYYFAYLVCVLLGIVSGTMYGFGRYARDLKLHLKLTHFEMEVFGILLDAGNFATKPICGAIYDRFGTRVTCVVSAILYFLTACTISSNGDATSHFDGRMKITTSAATSNKTRWRTWKNLDFWLLFVAFFACTGCGLVLINNVSTMVESMGGGDEFSSQLVVLLSVCNCVGRIITGILVDRISQTDLFATSLTIIFIGMLISALATTSQCALSCQVATVTLVSLAYGGAWVLIVTVVADWFGQERFGKNYGLAAIGPAFSGMVFNAVSAKHYHLHASRLVDDTSGSDVAGTISSEICLGVACYHATFVLATLASAVCVLVFPVIKLHHRSK